MNTPETLTALLTPKGNALKIRGNDLAHATVRKYSGPYVPEIKPEGTAKPVTHCAASMKPGKWPNGHYQYGDGDTPIYQRPGSDHSHIKSLGL